MTPDEAASPAPWGWKRDGDPEIIPTGSVARRIPVVVNGFGVPVVEDLIDVPTFRYRQRWVRTWAEVTYTEYGENDGDGPTP